MKVTNLHLEKRLTSSFILAAFLVAMMSPCFVSTSYGAASNVNDEAETVIEESESDVNLIPIAGATRALVEMQSTYTASVENSGLGYVSAIYPEEDEVNDEIVINDTSYTMYVTEVLNVREEPNTDSEVLGKLVAGDEITVTGEIESNDFVRITYKEEDAYIHSDYLSEDKPEIVDVITYEWDGAILNRLDGTVTGPSGKETYYNLPMEGVVKIMRAQGYSEEEYPYWVRSDGAKMLGQYVMVAANLNVRPRGSVLPCSLGMALVCDTGDFAHSNIYQLDVATTW